MLIFILFFCLFLQRIIYQSSTRCTLNWQVGREREGKKKYNIHTRLKQFSLTIYTFDPIVWTRATICVAILLSGLFRWNGFPQILFFQRFFCCFFCLSIYDTFQANPHRCDSAPLAGNSENIRNRHQLCSIALVRTSN